MREEERREAAWFRIPPRVPRRLTSLQCSVPFVSNDYVIEFSKSTEPRVHLNTAVQQQFQHCGHLDVSPCQTVGIPLD